MVINRSKRIMSLILTLFLTMTMVNMPSRAFAATEYTTDHELIELQASRSDGTIRTTLMAKKDGLNLGGLGFYYSFDDKVELDPFSTGRNVNASVLDGGKAWNAEKYKAGLSGTDHDVPAGTWLVYFTHTLKGEFQYDTEYEFAVNMDMAYEGKELEDYDWYKDTFKVIYAEYTVKFEAPDADTPVEETQHVVRGQQVTVPDDPQKTGYEFDGWEAAEGSTASISDAIMEPVTFHATWKEAPAADADVTVDPDGGTITPNDDVDKDGKIADGKKVGDTIKVPEIEKPGYTLKNWEDENGNPLQPGDEYTVPTGKGSLKPVWEANPADVTIDPDGGTITPNDDVDKDGKIADDKKVGDTIKVPEIEKPGYTLKNWEDENGNPLQPGDEYTVPTGKGSLKPVWEANPADVTVDPDGGTITPNDDVDKDGKIADGKKAGDTIKVPEIEKPGYTLKNWEDENGNPLQPGDEYTVPTGKGSLKPVWEANPADVTIDPDGGTITPNDDVDKDGKIADGKKVGDTIKVPDIEKPGYTLKNWEDENGNPLQPGDEYTVPTGKGSLKPVWEANPADVTIDPDGGTITPNDDVDKDGKIADGKKVGDTIKVPDIEKPGYTLKNWEDENGNPLQPGDEYTIPAEGGSLKPVWEANPADVTIDPDGGTITPNDDVDKDGKIADGKKVGDTIKVPDIEKPGYTLKNWEDENGNPLQPGDEYTIPADKGTLKPVWEAVTYKITYDLDGGTNAEANPTTYTAEDEITLADPTKAGYTFQSWAPDGKIAKGTTGNLSFKAVWEANPADVTIDPDGGTITPNDDVDKDGKIADGKKVGDTIKVPEIEKPGYTLKNWEDENGNPLQPGDEYTIPADKGTLKPVWEANPADVTVDPDGGTITPNDDVDKDGKIADGKKVGDTIKVPDIEKPGYTLKNWEDENGNPLQPGDEYTIPADKGTLKPVWEANPADTVTINPSENGTVTADTTTPKAGDEVTLTVNPDEGYTLDDLKVTDGNGNPIDLRANDDGTYSFTMPEPASAVVDATFKEEAKPSERRNLNTTDHIRYVQGYDDGTVRPAGNITRAETATMIYRLLTDAHRDEIFTSENPFTDVTANLWFNKAVSSMANGGYLKGYEDGTFLGNRNITRAEFATILTRFTNVEEKELNFSDLDNTIDNRHWAYNSIATGVSQGWINGYNDGTFRPDRAITRAEAMAMLNRFLGRGVNKESTLGDYVSFPDNSSSEWYYYEVIEATNDHEYEGTRPSENWTSNTVDHEYDIDKYERP